MSHDMTNDLPYRGRNWSGKDKGVGHKYDADRNPDGSRVDHGPPPKPMGKNKGKGAKASRWREK